MELQHTNMKINFQKLNADASILENHLKPWTEYIQMSNKRNILKLLIM